MKKFLIGVLFVFAAVGASSVIQAILSNNPNDSWLSDSALVDQVISEPLVAGDEVRSDVLNAKFKALNKKLDDLTPSTPYEYVRDLQNATGYESWEQGSDAFFSGGANLQIQGTYYYSYGGDSTRYVAEFNLDGDSATTSPIELEAGETYTIKLKVNVVLSQDEHIQIGYNDGSSDVVTDTIIITSADIVPGEGAVYEVTGSFSANVAAANNAFFIRRDKDNADFVSDISLWEYTITKQ